MTNRDLMDTYFGLPPSDCHIPSSCWNGIVIDTLWEFPLLTWYQRTDQIHGKDTKNNYQETRALLISKVTTASNSPPCLLHKHMAPSPCTPLHVCLKDGNHCP